MRNSGRGCGSNSIRTAPLLFPRALGQFAESSPRWMTMLATVFAALALVSRFFQMIDSGFAAALQEFVRSLYEFAVMDTRSELVCAPTVVGLPCRWWAVRLWV